MWDSLNGNVIIPIRNFLGKTLLNVSEALKLLPSSLHGNHSLTADSPIRTSKMKVTTQITKQNFPVLKAAFESKGWDIHQSFIKNPYYGDYIGINYAGLVSAWGDAAYASSGYVDDSGYNYGYGNTTIVTLGEFIDEIPPASDCWRPAEGETGFLVEISRGGLDTLHFHDACDEFILQKNQRSVSLELLNEIRAAVRKRMTTFQSKTYAGNVYHIKYKNV